MIGEENLIEIKPEVILSLPRELALHYNVIPISVNDFEIEVIADRDQDHDLISSELAEILNKKVSIEISESTAIQNAINKYYRKHLINDNTNIFNEEKTDFLDQLIKDAGFLKSSDIHIEACEQFSRVRMRVDGKLIERQRIEKKDYPSIVNRIKIRANLDISEKRLPQDGRINYRIENVTQDLRVSIIPGIFGEKIVLRILSRSMGVSGLKDLELSEKKYNLINEAVQSENGIILISGPTGSGKTTTLYATLSELNRGDNNILTIEDPVEYVMPGITQVQLKESIGLDFPKALKSFLRQDPDIIMLGEIRDMDTANMAIRSALTGHLVLSTIHTNSAWATVSRLLDMGIPPFLLAGTLKMTIAQRLVRKLCDKCKTQVKENVAFYPPEISKVIQNHILYQANGCEDCFFTGYSGRIAIHEIIRITSDLAQEIRRSNLEEPKILQKYGVKTLADESIDLVKIGITSFEEVYPIILNRC